MIKLARFIGTLGGTGYLRPGPGTWGSALAVLLAYPVYLFGGVWFFLGTTILAYGLGHWATTRIETEEQSHDPAHVVIDELVGQWIALWPVVIGAAHVGADPLQLWPGLVAAFVLFRLFDIFKPGPIGWADRKPGAVGVMLDDVFAGLAAAICVIILAAFSHGVLMS